MLSIPEQLWQHLLDQLAQHPREVERVAYLDGIRWSDSAGRQHGVVTTVTIPNATLTEGNYRVSAKNIAQAGRHLPDHGLVRLAQIHTHGNGWIDHSRVDDERAYTRRPGGISIVLPDHARNRPGPLEGGVHIRESNRWRRLSPEQAAEVIRIVPSDVDFRQGRRRWNWRNVPWKK